MTKQPKPKLTDAERHVRFVETAHEVGASEDPKDFERAFEAVTRADSPSRRNEPPKPS